MKILTIVGARPQFIKAATISREIRKRSGINEIIVHTGQHFDHNMSEVFFDEMDIPIPDYNLAINSLSHGAMTGRMIEEIEKVLIKEKPDWLLVYGDTNSTLAGALAAKKLHIKVAHVEAGLRSFNMSMPEEVNRILTDRISDVLICPTTTAAQNLANEGFDHHECEILTIGDVMYDAALYYRTRKRQPNVDLDKDFVLATIHRAENTNEPSRLKCIIESLNEINRENQVVVPLHPRTKKYIEQYELHIEFTCIEPLGYLEMIYLLEDCSKVITDSGGLQKEAYFFGKPCLTLRDETEWVELVEAGVNVLESPVSKSKVIDGYQKMRFDKINEGKKLYGDGNAAELVVKALLSNNS